MLTSQNIPWKEWDGNMPSLPNEKSFTEQPCKSEHVQANPSTGSATD